MRMELHQFFSILLFVACFEYGATRNKTQWTVVPDPEIVNTFSSVARISALSTSTVTHCAVECYVTQGCVSIGYTPSTRACFMYKTDLGHLASGDRYTSSDHIDYYKVTCNLDYLYVRHLDTCVKLVDKRVTWEIADATCRAENAHLLTVKTNEMMTLLKELVVYWEIQHHWIGAVPGSGTDDWYWQTGEVINATTGGQFWLPGSDRNIDCVTTQCVDGQYGFQVRNCSSEQKYICQAF